MRARTVGDIAATMKANGEPATYKLIGDELHIFLWTASALQYVPRTWRGRCVVPRVSGSSRRIDSRSSIGP